MAQRIAHPRLIASENDIALDIDLVETEGAGSWEPRDGVLDLIRWVVQRELGRGRYSITLHLVGDAEMRQLNRDLRGKDTSTDVLSFPLYDPNGMPFVTPRELPVALGDVVVSYPHVLRQAREYGHSYGRELAYLAVHGVLHVLGHDHELEEEQRLMRQREEEALAAFGLTRD